MRSVKQILLAEFVKSAAYCDEAEYGLGIGFKAKAFAEIFCTFVKLHKIVNGE